MQLLRTLCSFLVFVFASNFSVVAVAGQRNNNNYEEQEINSDGTNSDDYSNNRLVTFRNNFQNQTLMMMWLGSLQDDESHMSDPILVSEALPEEDVKVNTFTGHIFLIQVKETLKVIGEKVIIKENLDFYELGPRGGGRTSKGSDSNDVSSSSKRKRRRGNNNNDESSSTTEQIEEIQMVKPPRSKGNNKATATTRLSSSSSSSSSLPYPHPNPHIHLLGTGTTAMSAKFRSLVPSMDMWYEDHNGGSFQGTLTLGRESTTNTYEGHVFFFTETGNKGK